MYNISKNNIKKLKINKSFIGFELKSDDKLNTDLILNEKIPYDFDFTLIQSR